MPHMALPKTATEAHEPVLDGRPSDSESAHSSVDGVVDRGVQSCRGRSKDQTGNG
jgi:hypothetical protein